MQIQSTLLFLTTLLAATSALPDSQQKRYKVGEIAYYPGVTAEIRGWAKDSCSAHDKPSYSHTVDQMYCYTVPKTALLSYKLWQPIYTIAAWECTFTLYEDPSTCTGFYVAPTNLSPIEKTATCNDGLRHYEDNQKTSFGSFRYTCQCVNPKGCIIPYIH